MDGDSNVDFALADIIGTFAAILTTTAFFPQAYKTLRTRDTAGMSLTMYGLMMTGVALWLVYGLIIHSWPVIIANAVVLLPQAAIATTLISQQRSK